LEGGEFHFRILVFPEHGEAAEDAVDVHGDADGLLALAGFFVDDRLGRAVEGELFFLEEDFAFAEADFFAGEGDELLAAGVRFVAVEEEGEVEEGFAVGGGIAGERGGQIEGAVFEEEEGAGGETGAGGGGGFEEFAGGFGGGEGREEGEVGVGALAEAAEDIFVEMDAPAVFGPGGGLRVGVGREVIGEFDQLGLAEGGEAGVGAGFFHR